MICIKWLALSALSPTPPGDNLDCLEEKEKERERKGKGKRKERERKGKGSECGFLIDIYNENDYENDLIMIRFN